MLEAAQFLNDEHWQLEDNLVRQAHVLPFREGGLIRDY